MSENDRQGTDEETVERALVALLNTDEAREILAAEGLEIVEAGSFARTGFLGEEGIAIFCEDGSKWTLPIACYERPRT